MVEVAAQAGHSATMTLNTHGHVIDDVALRTDTETVICKARASMVRQWCVIGSVGEDWTPQNRLQ